MKSKYTETYFEKTREDFRSDEELEFWCWLNEAEENKLVSGILYEATKFELSRRSSIEYEKQLKTKTKICYKFLFHQHSYTPDFEFTVIHESLDQYFINTSYLAKNTILVDVKGSFNKFGDPKQFSINQKWCWDKFDAYIQKIVPGKFFKETWVPKIAMLSPKQKKPVKKYVGCKDIDKFKLELKRE